MMIFGVKTGQILTPDFRSTFGAIFEVAFEEGLGDRDRSGF